MNKIVVGVLGYGRIGQIHVKAMMSNPHVHISWVVDAYMTEEMASSLREQGVSHVGKDADEMFLDPKIKAVFICAPTDTHFDFSMRAIATGTHVFCEKPVDMDLSRIKKVWEALEGKGLVYQVGFNRRFDHNFQSVRDAIKAKKIGRPQMIRITSRDVSPPSLDYLTNSGGLFMDMMIHDFDMVRFQTQSEVVEVYAKGAVLVDEAIRDAGDIDSAIVVLSMANGMIGYIENCRQAVYGYDQRLEVLGTEGSISIENDTPSTTIISNKEGVSKENPLRFFLERYTHAYEKEQLSFFQSIDHHTASVCGIKEGYESVRIAYAAKQSFQEKRPIILERSTHE